MSWIAPSKKFVAGQGDSSRRATLGLEDGDGAISSEKCRNENSVPASNLGENSTGRNLLSFFDSMIKMNNRHRKIWEAIFHTPTSATVVFADIEALVVHLGGQVLERQGSRVKLVLREALWRCHRPHPGKEAKKYQVEEAREFFQRAGVEL
ncbi:type II toxin-antitoxin system HicA family toxin [Pseudomonas frederiksbergensis]|uniref:type II toxin-antitoxin system HicA family toxin n=1 Tax=Pseudomonas frederiksbergensis TaxID=104087 RepID=UPI002DB9081F|nr:type II toxin-antitoxin system HicA family toxin [Pseudomonas frederiksbergensis]WRV70175.1 type II toxin-antitoxin system HicA family toxin [Pseudomonas frederiksbergensis]